jgi:hypothetical protein
MQLTGQTGSQAPQSMQSAALMKRLPSTSEIQLTGQTGSQAPQFTHSSFLIILAMTLSFYSGYFIPSFFKSHIMGHQFVKADCNRFSPMNAVNQSHSGLT